MKPHPLRKFPAALALGAPTAGPDDEQHGLFAAIVPVPEPSTHGLAASLALAGVTALARFRRQRSGCAAQA